MLPHWPKTGGVVSIQRFKKKSFGGSDRYRHGGGWETVGVERGGAVGRLKRCCVGGIMFCSAGDGVSLQS